MNNVDERNVNPIQEMTRIAEDFLRVHSWGFNLTFRSEEPSELIFDSDLCRLHIGWDGWDYLGGNTIHIMYGRLHASNGAATMVWHGEECNCWHRLPHPLYFLDSYPPAEAAKLNYAHPVTAPFFEEQFRKNYSRRQPEWLAAMHTTVWKHYGQRFFELFDLRRPDSWEQYRQFLKEFYDIKGRSRAIKPPLDKVC